ncbi:Non-reducing polyketide synthase pyr2 [Penicillium cosmopolitanum]|uniref:Non-reducing polyketide synthase pyr2 n=1 Tax=Penicillium cosmopolitanum TaxID=1131564 RepID=A0A9W9VT46_9EURO|nr:Non-reducing polyketide synthase pyr2 [Penicillium cosmopolitanum]KAJ5388861.1 Non-reducing polyketide synthase pyr2 [Penicillium cosmopolitanum]
MNEPIAIVGTGCRFPGASTSPSKLWQLLCQPRDLSQEVPADRFQIDAVYHPDVDHHGTTNVRCGYFLEEDIQHFDAALFNVSPAEARAMDPQQRLLLETVYEALEQGGFRLDALRGSATGVFCGYLHNDYGQLQSADVGAYPPYALVGNSPSMLANRVSYYFDWTGPSLSVNTGCSSSLLAVHQAVESLRRGECSTAVVAASNLLLTPDIFITAAKTGMLSPSGQCRMWDVKADGYGRGEGVAAVVLKRLSDAVADGDQIESLIRATGTNADGRTLGILMPNGKAQQRLIERTYTSIGLDARSPRDRCQYFEAHGTGTKAGDPQEATAIYNAFFDGAKDADFLYVGSIKTVIGHTEATAGLAGLIKASLSVQYGTITPNRLLQEINPKIKPLTSHLRVPDSCISWPDRPAGVPRRASVNSFGFGGTNVHVILDSYDPPSSGPDHDQPRAGALFRLPLCLSAASDRAIGTLVERFAQFLRQNPEIDLEDLADTLLTRRSALSHRVVLVADGRKELLREVDQIASLLKAGSINAPVIRARDLNRAPRILGVFTGQGVQWAQMGVDLLKACPAAQGWMKEFQDSLDGLPEPYRPHFSLHDELSAPSSSSRLREPLIAQSLLTAVQIIQTNLLRSLGVCFDLVVGHSSGEIAAAYAAGMLSAQDAMRVAYLRGFASQNGGNGPAGAMMAVDVTWSQAAAICHQPPYHGKVTVGAYNSPSSVTLSGDVDVLWELHWLLQSLEKSPVMLPVDIAYHSAHMAPCAELYQQALHACSIEIHPPSKARWVSSVYLDREVQREDLVDSAYWTENMLRPVHFAQAIRTAVTHTSSALDAVIEIGAHSTLRNPVLRTISSQRGSVSAPAYIAMGRRQTSSIQTLAHAIGNLWAHLGPSALMLAPCRALFYDNPHSSRRALLRDLPVYPFDHLEQYWTEPRWSHGKAHGHVRPNALLGISCVQAGGTDRLWRTYIRREELSWLSTGPVSPALYVSMAVEAAVQLVGKQNLRFVRISNLEINGQIPAPDPGPGVELLFQLSTVHAAVDTAREITAAFTCLAAVDEKGLQRIVYGNLVITLGPLESSLLPLRMEPELGSTVKSAVLAKANTGNEPGGGIYLHPATLHAALHLLVQGTQETGCEGAPPALRSIEHIAINPCSFGISEIRADAVVEREEEHVIWGAVDLFDVAGHGFVQLEGIRISRAANPTGSSPIFHETTWQPLHPDATSGSSLCSRFLEESVLRCDRLALMYLRQAIEQSTAEKWRAIGAQLGTCVTWMDQLFSEDIIYPEWLADTPASLRAQLREAPWDDDMIRTDRAGQQLSQFLSLTLDSIIPSPDPISQLQLLELGPAGEPAPASILSDGISSLSCRGHCCLSVSDPVEDLEIEMASQGIRDSAYDVVLVNETLDRAAEIVPALHAIRQRLRVGGYLVVIAATDPKRVHLAFRPGVHIRTRVALSGYSIMVSQAVDENLRLLRDPLARTSLPLGGSLVVVSPGPTIPAVSPLLSPIFGAIREVFLQSDPDRDVLGLASAVLVMEGSTPWTTRQQAVTEQLLALSNGPVLWVTEDDGHLDQCGIHDLLATNLARIRLVHLPNARTAAPDALATLLLQWIYSQRGLSGYSVLAGTSENDIRLRGGVLEIPRQVPHAALNRRLHPYQDMVPAGQAQIQYQASSGDATGFSLVAGHVFADGVMNPGDIRLSVRFSTIGAIPVAGCFLHLVLGWDQQSQSRMLALTNVHCGTISSPPDWCCEVPKGLSAVQEPTYLADVAAGLNALRKLRQQLLSCHITGLGSLNPAHKAFMSLVSNALSQDQDTPVSIVSHCIPVSKTSGLSYRRGLGKGLDTVVGLMQSPCSSSSKTQTPVISLQDLRQHCQDISATSGVVLDWTAQSLVPAWVRLAHQTITFSPHRSYLLHLSTPLAQSVCEWMLSRGAQHVILIDTDVEAAWKTEMGSRIRLVDLSIRDLAQLTESAARDGPAVAGVILGSIESSISLRLLSAIDFSPALDFFVALDELSPPSTTPFWSSSTLSTYRTALIHRQRIRGIAASILHHNTALSPQSSPTSPTCLVPPETHEALAQAILGASQGNWQVTALLSQASNCSVTTDEFARHPKMWHLAPDLDAPATRDPTTAPLSDRQRIQRALKQADNFQEGTELMAQAITRQLCHQLQLPRDAAPPDDTPLGDLGWDSMMAMQLRVWMGRHLAVDLPVVQMMGGSCIRDIAREAAENLKAKEGGI